MYRYYCAKNPPEHGKLTELGLLSEPLRGVQCYAVRYYVPEIDRMAWGWVEYDHELTPEEVAKYGLIMEPRGAPAEE